MKPVKCQNCGAPLPVEASMCDFCECEITDDELDASADVDDGDVREDEEEDDDELICSFCGKSQDEVEKLLTGASANICNECVEMCYEMLQ
jgi:hypothetical protein